MITLKQIPFESEAEIEGTDQRFYIVNVTFPDEGDPVYVIDGLEPGEAIMKTPDNMKGFTIQIRNDISTTT